MKVHAPIPVGYNKDTVKIHGRLSIIFSIATCPI